MELRRSHAMVIRATFGFIIGVEEFDHTDENLGSLAPLLTDPAPYLQALPAFADTRLALKHSCAGLVIKYLAKTLPNGKVLVQKMLGSASPFNPELATVTVDKADLDLIISLAENGPVAQACSVVCQKFFRLLAFAAIGEPLVQETSALAWCAAPPLAKIFRHMHNLQEIVATPFTTSEIMLASLARFPGGDVGCPEFRDRPSHCTQCGAFSFPIVWHCLAFVSCRCECIDIGKAQGFAMTTERASQSQSPL
jgi:hypothetical protein